MAEEECRHSLHVVVFPWLAFGHLIPFLELSKSLAQRGHRVSFLSTPRNIQRLPKLPPNLAPSVDLVELPLPRPDDDHNLPEGAEATVDLPVHKVQYLKEAFDGLEAPFARFLERSTPDWILFDFSHHWLPPIAAKLGVRCAYLNILNAALLAFLGPPSLLLSGTDERTAPEHFTVPPKWIPFPSELSFRYHEIQRILHYFSPNSSGVSDMFRAGSVTEGCDFVAIRTCPEYESELLSLLEEDLYRKPVIPVGLLPPSAEYTGDSQNEEKWVPIRDWLDGQKKESVVYVALGSEAALTQEEMTELAVGLELSGLPFFWVLRRPPGSDRDESFALPDGFEDRTKGRGVVCEGWAPQVRILAHESVGGFLTHCGWGSIVEGLAFGRALLLLPFLTDQGLNARVLEGKKLGLEVPRDERTGWFTRNSVAESLRMVMVDEEGEMYRSRAKAMAEIFGDKDRHDRYFDRFVRYLVDHRRPSPRG